MNIKKLMIVSLVVLAMTTAVFGQGRGRYPFFYNICYNIDYPGGSD
jgi:hypothetical protein